MTVKVVAFGGGHGLGASLRALRRIRPELDLELTAVVTVGDNGGSSGRLRAERGILPPGDLRQALAALSAEDETSALTAALLQHRFTAAGFGDEDPLTGHAVGNLLLCGLMELLGDPIAALDHAAGLVRAQGRVLPMSKQGVQLEADVRGADPAAPDEVSTVHGQHEVAVTRGTVQQVRLLPKDPPACPEALTAVAEADWLIFGPGSWYTSVIPHLLVPELATAILASRARRLVLLNLAAEKETLGLSAADHLAALGWYLPGFCADVVLADPAAVGDPEPVAGAAESLGARLVLAPVAVPDGSPRHDPVTLGAALVPVLEVDR
ncbi:gluconeogenesis factor YvcK family protein [Catenuloplanes atrovinosus]|uniref:Putative gluconeogenesis factor n=1 Tax=Catenuloplanes atrovinosus TaxID=137266 RepID=A0AAE3YR00_9ACTN|nr:uridine diphosphate-N-acetylglucosamine-binding protein YvcK [Catenuloplanes atrovinosus]MDR7278015.1 putative cofD-like protein [Catenuloplanes atrovinosus]